MTNEKPIAVEPDEKINPPVVEEDMTSALWRNPLTTSKLRNKPCICGSGKKTKKCHGIKNAISRTELNEIQVWYKESMARVVEDLSAMKSVIEEQEKGE